MDITLTPPHNLMLHRNMRNKQNYYPPTLPVCNHAINIYHTKCMVVFKNPYIDPLKPFRAKPEHDHGI